ncbi:HAD family hydrolase [Arsenicitalea aurantiaca]|uniref:HAD family hydrolase n=1 Tax=Arsenicitalea aurantiaca TaxID=1783274 RepID=A0A433XFT6_9HYPH|nr:HAD-IA family hydrolase [Arsenicitalea aurantiaca]RUT32971.1 HAD family hydrolase [Arsenicitalea aurantiaca]
MKLIVFDVDGTLIDTHTLIAEHMASAFTGAGLVAPTPSEVRRIIGLSLPVAIAELARSEDQVLVAALVEAYKGHYRAAVAIANDREPLFPGTREALDRLRLLEETLLGVATGKALAGLERILALHGLRDHFVTLQTPDHNPSKPHPGMLLRAMAETGVAPEDTVMIGDTVFDMQLAKSAGAKAIGVGWGYHERHELEQAGADVLIESFEDLDAALLQLEG